MMIFQKTVIHFAGRLPTESAGKMMVRFSFLSIALLSWVLIPAAAIADDAPGKNEKPQEKPVEAEETKDPLEPINRFTFSLNTALRTVIINPLIDVYQAVTPDPMEEAISNAASNLTEPVTAVSSLLQGDTENAKKSTQRFLVNTTAGLGGTRDVAAEEMGLERRKEDLGQAMGAGGMESGPYLVLPIFGPSTTRDAIGDVAVTVAVPPAALANTADNTATYAENKDAIDALTRNALDPYIVEREAYLQHRRTQVLNSQAPLEEIPDFDEKK